MSDRDETKSRWQIYHENSVAKWRAKCELDERYSRPEWKEAHQRIVELFPEAATNLPKPYDLLSINSLCTILECSNSQFESVQIGDSWNTASDTSTEVSMDALSRLPVLDAAFANHPLSEGPVLVMGMSLSPDEGFQIRETSGGQFRQYFIEQPYEIEFDSALIWLTAPRVTIFHHEKFVFHVFAADKK